LNPPFQPTRPNAADLFISLLLVGLQSFGGGSSTLGLIHQLAVQRGWLSEEEFTRTWALVQLAPGINLIKLTILIGYRLRGWVGALVAASGLLLPSSAVTVLMTAGFASVRDLPWIQAMLKGILPAVIGVSLATGIQMVDPQLRRAHREGTMRLIAHIFILVSAALLIGIAKVSPVIILVSAGIAAAGLFHFTAKDQPMSINDKDST
jgi:chromate transporter